MSSFDTIHQRRQTGSIKFDRRPELDPYWVADMDFTSAPEILDALHRRIDHGIFGYAMAHEELNESLASYLQTRHQVELDAAHVVHLGGLVPALSLAARAFCQAGQALMTCTPVYYPFLGIHRDAAGVEKITVDHVWRENRWEFDWEAMEKSVTPQTRLFLLCNPQNPLGRVFSYEELEKLATFCEHHDLILISDEIHCDLILNDAEHVCALRLPERFHSRLIVLLSPSKTWNIAGLGYAFAVIPSDTLRRQFSAARGHTLPEINALSFYAAEAAYRHGEPWRQELLAYLRENRRVLEEFFAKNLATSPLRLLPTEATYLAWIDAREMKVANPAQWFEQHAGLFLTDGAAFGWAGFLRFNFACPRARLLSGLEKIANALRDAPQH